MKMLILLQKKAKCSFCEQAKETSPVYSDGTSLYCINHAAEEMVRPEPEQTTVERYLERLTPKQLH